MACVRPTDMTTRLYRADVLPLRGTLRVTRVVLSVNNICPASHFYTLRGEGGGGVRGGGGFAPLLTLSPLFAPPLYYLRQLEFGLMGRLLHDKTHVWAPA